MLLLRFLQVLEAQVPALAALQNMCVGYFSKGCALQSLHDSKKDLKSP